MQIAPGLRRRGLEERRDSRINTLETGEVELRHRVGMLKRIDHRLRRAVIRRRLVAPPPLKHHLRARRFCLVARWPERAAFAFATEVADQRRPAAARDGETLGPPVGA